VLRDAGVALAMQRMIRLWRNPKTCCSSEIMVARGA
jgi:hypothetical protein